MVAQNDQSRQSMDDLLERDKLNDRLDKIKHKIFVFSGKGGVGKSTVAVNIAASLANSGHRVGLLDIDIHGPSVPKLLNIENQKLAFKDNIIQPIDVENNLKVVSIGFLLDNDSTPVIWRGPRKMGVIKQFVKDVDWGELDYLIVDSPPGTGDEPLSICQLIPEADGAVIVTTPQDVAVVDVQKAITFCHQLNVNVFGVVENMDGFTCPHCGEEVKILKSGGGRKLADRMNVPFMGSIPIDPNITTSGDDGLPYVYGTKEGSTSKAFKTIVDFILEAEKN